MSGYEPDRELRAQLDDLARACRILEMEGHGDMTLGHLSLRASDGHGFWMKRNRMGLGEILGADDFVLLDWNGQQLHGTGARHSEWPIHSEILRARPDVNVVAHTHPFYACVFSASTDPLMPYAIDGDYLLDVPRHQDEVALITTKEEGAALARSLGNRFAVLMSNHGITFCGTSVQHATCVGIFLEKACKAQITGSGAGFRASFPAPATREKRHRQIMTPVHWEHSWNYFSRKLDHVTDARNGEPRAIYR